jgi:hypothetical protein
MFPLRRMVADFLRTNLPILNQGLAEEYQTFDFNTPEGTELYLHRIATDLKFYSDMNVVVAMAHLTRRRIQVTIRNRTSHGADRSITVCTVDPVLLSDSTWQDMPPLQLMQTNGETIGAHYYPIQGSLEDVPSQVFRPPLEDDSTSPLPNASTLDSQQQCLRPTRRSNTRRLPPPKVPPPVAIRRAPNPRPIPTILTWLRSDNSSAMIQGQVEQHLQTVPTPAPSPPSPSPATPPVPQPRRGEG